MRPGRVMPSASQFKKLAHSNRESGQHVRQFEEVVAGELSRRSVGSVDQHEFLLGFDHADDVYSGSEVFGDFRWQLRPAVPATRISLPCECGGRSHAEAQGSQRGERVS